MTKTMQLLKSIMAVLGCVFCILLALTKLSRPLFDKRSSRMDRMVLEDMKVMCARMDCAMDAIRNGGELDREMFCETNCFARRRFPNGDFYNVAMIANTDPKAWDREERQKAPGRACCYFVVQGSGGTSVWKMCGGGENPLRQMTGRTLTVSERQNLFEVFDETYGGEDHCK